MDWQKWKNIKTTRCVWKATPLQAKTTKVILSISLGEYLYNFLNVPLALRYYTQRCACLGHFSPLVSSSSKQSDITLPTLWNLNLIGLVVENAFLLGHLPGTKRFSKETPLFRSQSVNDKYPIKSTCDVFETIWGFDQTFSFSTQKQDDVLCFQQAEERPLDKSTANVLTMYTYTHS